MTPRAFSPQAYPSHLLPFTAEANHMVKPNVRRVRQKQISWQEAQLNNWKYEVNQLQLNFKKFIIRVEKYSRYINMCFIKGTIQMPK